jgi:DNA-binding beta-propeller fold protein YncE
MAADRDVYADSARDRETDTAPSGFVYGGAQATEYTGAPRRRPRFSHDVEQFPLHLPPGREIGRCIAIAQSPVNGDLFLLNYSSYGPYIPADPAARLRWIVRLDSEGRYIHDFGGEDQAPVLDGVSQWPAGPDNVEVDAEGNLWIGGYHAEDAAIVGYSPDGEFLRQFGQRGRPGDNDDTRYMRGPVSVYNDVENHEVFVADGYGNSRVIAFDSDTGECTRMWGAYGKKPSSLSPEEGFRSPVHKIVCAPDGLLLVADRTNNRVQEFERVPGGIRYVREAVVGPGTYSMGSAFDIAVTPDNRYLYVADGMGMRLWTVDRETFEVLGWTTAAPERESDDNIGANRSPFHRMALLSSGDILAGMGRRGVRRLRYLGVS